MIKIENKYLFIEDKSSFAKLPTTYKSWVVLWWPSAYFGFPTLALGHSQHRAGPAPADFPVKTWWLKTTKYLILIIFPQFLKWISRKKATLCTDYSIEMFLAALLNLVLVKAIRKFVAKRNKNSVLCVCHKWTHFIRDSSTYGSWVEKVIFSSSCRIRIVNTRKIEIC